MDMYYGEEALSSVYVWDIDNGFAAAILFKKTMIGENSGCWDAINIMEVVTNSFKINSSISNLQLSRLDFIFSPFLFTVNLYSLSKVILKNHPQNVLGNRATGKTIALQTNNDSDD